MEGNNMPRFGANLGALFTQRPLIERFGAPQPRILLPP
jgi:hydroxypyruvate isomerase